MGGVRMVEGTPERIFARRMRQERVRRGWRQEDLANAMAARGLKVHPSAIARSERESDSRMIRLDEAVLVAAIFDLSLSQMITPEETDPAIELGQLGEALARLHHERMSRSQQLAAVQADFEAISEQIARVEWEIEVLQSPGSVEDPGRADHRAEG
jgi:transcriptional regulator with XRE-family HTH domain